MSKICFIVPIYNVSAYIEECIISIQKQSLSDFSCLLIDDGSPDDSCDKAINLIKDDARFSLLHKENGGLSDARNFGLDRVDGEYVCFVDSDDYLDLDMAKLTYELAIKDNSEIVCFDLMYFYEDGRLEVSSGGKEKLTSYKENKELITYNNSANNKLFKTSFLNDKRFIKGIWYEDLASIPLWLAKADKVSYLNKPLYYYRQREGSISHSANEKIFDIFIALKNVKDGLNVDAKELESLYLNDGLLMTYIRIKEIDDKDMRLSFYQRLKEEMDKAYPTWFEDYKGNWKRKIIYYLLKNKHYKLLDKLR